ncbi:MAG: methionyl-tRNA formyltransferase [Chloroflexi bacterium]|nr:methionyl-tRNA formyltransferase [Chloroflexota bacterium]
MARVIFMGTPDFAVPALEQLVRGGSEVVAVYAQPDRPSGRGRQIEETPVKRRALQLGLRVCTPKTLRAPEAIDELRSFSPEVLVVAAYGKILPQAVLDAAPKGALNIHPSLLPKYRGPSPLAAAILAGDRETGVTIMLLDAGMDTGPVLAQRRTPIHDDDTTGSLGERLAREGAELLTETLSLWLAGSISPRAQDEREATVTKLVEKEDGRIEWSRLARELWLQTRAYSPWPGSFTTWRGANVKILQARPLDGVYGAPGAIVLLNATGDGERGRQLAICAGSGALVVERLQLEGKRAMTAQEFLAGRPDFPGERLPS